MQPIPHEPLQKLLPKLILIRLFKYLRHLISYLLKLLLQLVKRSPIRLRILVYDVQEAGDVSLIETAVEFIDVCGGEAEAFFAVVVEGCGVCEALVGVCVVVAYGQEIRGSFFVHRGRGGGCWFADAL